MIMRVSSPHTNNADFLIFAFYMMNLVYSITLNVFPNVVLVGCPENTVPVNFPLINLVLFPNGLQYPVNFELSPTSRVVTFYIYPSINK